MGRRKVLYLWFPIHNTFPFIWSFLVLGNITGRGLFNNCKQSLKHHVKLLTTVKMHIKPHTCTSKEFRDVPLSTGGGDWNLSASHFSAASQTLGRLSIPSQCFSPTLIKILLKSRWVKRVGKFGAMLIASHMDYL